jgi:hypothetical protein
MIRLRHGADHNDRKKYIELMLPRREDSPFRMLSLPSLTGIIRPSEKSVVTKCDIIAYQFDYLYKPIKAHNVGSHLQ